jgi:hypothetical protein
MQSLHSFLILFLVTYTLGFHPISDNRSQVAGNDIWPFIRDVLAAFTRLNGAWPPEVRSYKTLEDFAGILSAPPASPRNTTHSPGFTKWKSPYLNASTPNLRLSTLTSNLLDTEAKEPKAVFAHFMVSPHNMTWLQPPYALAT